MKVHHLNCGSFCPLLGFGDQAITHCVLVETPADGLVLVDTGIGDAVTASPRQRMSWMNRALLRPRFIAAESALAHVQRLGFSPADVRHIIVTHLDVDHAGGLCDFPLARVHVHAAELAEARAERDPRYDPSLFAHGVSWETYAPEGEDWFGFDAVRRLRGLPPEIALVPLAGHTEGHSGVAIQSESGWLLHAGDAYLHPADLAGEHVPWSSRLAAWVTASDAKARASNLIRLRQLTRDARAPVRCFCSHSPDELFGLVPQAPDAAYSHPS